MLLRHRRESPEETRERIHEYFSEEKSFERLQSQAFATVDTFVQSDWPSARVLYVDNINYLGIMQDNDIARVKSTDLAGLVQAVYARFGTVAPSDDLTRWVYDADGREHVATTPTEFGLDIVETRFRHEESDPSTLPTPQHCGMYTLDLVRHPDTV